MTEPRNQCHDMSSQLARRAPHGFKKDPNQEKYLKLKDEFDDYLRIGGDRCHIQGSEE